ncbi:coenzyme F420-0:L-glutamate ligase [Candidatus Thorarchaeota archaeon]|nr:MAG: coenzyme F420-0:L-glutamate ligase [Candidatus Thorarchaeota archaeon]
MVESIRILGLEGLPLVQPGDDIGKLIFDAAKQHENPIREGDILVVAQKIVSKAEGRVVRSSDVTVSAEAKAIALGNGFDPVQVELALTESKAVIRTERALITETKNGHVCNFTGVDKSNTEPNSYILLPENPDLSARRIRSRIRSLLDVDVGVVISDSQGRPWRKGSVSVAIGVDGLNAFKHNEGKRDLFGRVLQRSMACQVDEIASAAEPVMGQGAEGVPVAIVRGYPYEMGSEKAEDIARPAHKDVFR